MPSEPRPTPRSLWGWVLLLLAALASVRARGQIEALSLALALVIGGAALARGLAARAGDAPPPPVPEFVALLAFATIPPSRLGHALAGVGAALLALLPRAEDERRASVVEEGLALLAALGASFLVLRSRSSPVLGLLALLAVEAFGPRAPRSGRRARRRLPGFVLLAATALLEGYEWWEPVLPARACLLLAAAAVAASATWDVLARATAEGRLVTGAVLVVGATLAPADAHGFMTAAPGWLALALAVGLLPHHQNQVGVAGPSVRRAALLVLALVLARAHAPFVDPPSVVAVLGLAFFALAASAVAFGRGAEASILATVLAGLVALEGGLRMKQRGSPDLVSPTAAPLVAERPPGWGLDGPLRHDLRGRPFSRVKPAGTHRIVLLGGSSAYGHGQTDASKALPLRLEAHLGRRKQQSTPEVLCLAFPGYASDHELAAVLGEAIDWEADLYLAIDGYNDLSYLSGRDTYPGDFYTWPQHRRGLSEALRRFVATRSLLLRPLATRDVVLPHWDRERLGPGAGNGFWLDGLVRNEESLAVIARDLGAHFVWASVPLVYDRGAALGPNEAAARREEPYATEVARRSAELRQRVGPAVIARSGHVLDLATAIARRAAAARDEQWFLDDCHYTDRGMDVLAEETVAALVAAGVVP